MTTAEEVTFWSRQLMLAEKLKRVAESHLADLAIRNVMLEQAPESTNEIVLLHEMESK